MDIRPIGETVDIDGNPVTVSNPRVRKMVVSDSGDWVGTPIADGQFLVVDIRGIEAENFAYPLSVSLDGTLIGSDARFEALENTPSPDQPPIDPRTGDPPYAGIDIPVDQYDSAAVVWPGSDHDVAWELALLLGFNRLSAEILQ